MKMTQLKQPSHLYASRQDKREEWIKKRLSLEATNYKHNRNGTVRKSRWSLFNCLIWIFGILLRLTGWHKRGLRNAQNLVFSEIVVEFTDLPESFHDYTILHLTDLHLDFVQNFEYIVTEKIKGISCDLCVITGDYRKKTHNGYRQVIEPMKRIVRALEARDGILSTLGNHDTCRMVQALEEMGVTVLANETVTFQRQNEELTVTGIDDPHYYFTPGVISALNESNGGFKIILVHTPEIYDMAATNEYRLYLCGHTHGGQICLPGGLPIITHLKFGKEFYRGLWQYKGMLGFTNSGCGSVGIPTRFNSSGEVVLIRLKKKGYQRSGRIRAINR